MCTTTENVRCRKPHEEYQSLSKIEKESGKEIRSKAEEEEEEKEHVLERKREKEYGGEGRRTTKKAKCREYGCGEAQCRRDHTLHI